MKDHFFDPVKGQKKRCLYQLMTMGVIIGVAFIAIAFGKSVGVELIGPIFSVLALLFFTEKRSQYDSQASAAMFSIIENELVTQGAMIHSITEGMLFSDDFYDFKIDASHSKTPFDQAALSSRAEELYKRSEKRTEFIKASMAEDGVRWSSIGKLNVVKAESEKWSSLLKTLEYATVVFGAFVALAGEWLLATFVP